MAAADLSTLQWHEILALCDTLIVHAPARDDGAVLPFILIAADGRIYGFNGHVDLGTGIRTALAQVVAEELDAPFGAVTMVLGDTGRTPDQGATIASDTMQTTARPLRFAAAQARRLLVERAADRLNVAVAEVIVRDGLFGTAGGNGQLSYGELVAGHRDRLTIDETTPVKPVAAYGVVGRSQPRVDIPAKATGQRTFVHDMRVPGMLHGRVIRPPLRGVDSAPLLGASLVAVDEGSVAHVDGLVAIVTIGDFIGVVARREEDAIAAMRALRVEWRENAVLPDLSDLETALRDNPASERRLHDTGSIEDALTDAAQRIDRTYLWPYQMHGSIGPSCALADYRDGDLRIWSGTQNPHLLRLDIAMLLDLAPDRIDIVRMEAAGCYGRNCADDVAADAALLSRAVGSPVRVQLMREQEHLWEPKGAGQLMEVRGGLDDRGNVAAYDFSTRYPSNAAPTLALILTGKIAPDPAVLQMGDRTSIAPYDFPAMRTTVHDMPPIVRASWLRGVSALPNSFAHESWIDEAAYMAGVDPVDYRLQFLHDARGVEVVRATAERGDWQPRVEPRRHTADGIILKGQGFAYALYVHSKFPGYGAAWAAWVADVSVNRLTGEIRVDRVTVGHDAGLVINPDGVRHQIHGNVVQSTSRALLEQVEFDADGVAALEWGGYPLLTFPDVPEIDVVMLPRPDQPPLGVGESASVPSAAAIANALFDATGIRFRDPPFTPEKVRAALAAAGLLATQDDGPADVPLPAPTGHAPRARRRWRPLAAAMTLAGMAAAVAWPWRGTIAPVARADPGFYSQATIERGRRVAATGDCAVCHTAPGGAANAGGLAMETPFGTVYSTNITPDELHGIGRWSYAAFERAMRQGISRDGRHLYPAFPYTAFARIDDADMEALYAFLMAQPAVARPAPATRLAFPFGVRPLLAVWNAMFLDGGRMVDDPARSAEWNRGRYLVEGAGHCAACHSPRNALGAERGGAAHLTGAMIDGWFAPSLTGSNDSPAPWREQDLYAYLRSGRSPNHGAAAGPMGPVIDALQAVPDADIRAMAVYLASFQTAAMTDAGQSGRVDRAEMRADRQQANLRTAGGRMYETACAACHDRAAAGYSHNPGPSLALAGTVAMSRPDNLIQVILDGIDGATARQRGGMPGFREGFDDRQVAELVRYIRQRFASDRPPWDNLDQTIREIRVRPVHAAH